MIPQDPTVIAGADAGAPPTLADPPLIVGAPLGGAPMTEDSVPLAALAAADESNTMATPAVGDRVSYTVDGKIIRIVGDRAFIQKESVNGQDVAGGDGPPDEAAGDTGPDNIDKLSADAGAMDNNQPV